MLRKAKRKNAKLKLALQGPSGSGKTYSALLIAFGLCGDWNKIAVIDTENYSSELYSDLGDFNVLPILEPYAPEKYVEAIGICEKEGMEVIIIDSISHEWEGQGGILDIHGNMAGNSFANWAKVTPRHNNFTTAIIQSSCHVIGTIRTKQDYVLSDKNGKMVPEKVGLKGVTRDGMDYEFTLVYDIDIKHQATASKDRTGLYADKPSRVLGSIDGMLLKSWCEAELSLDDIKLLIADCKSIEELKEVYKQYPSYQEKLLDNFKSKRDQLEAESKQTFISNFQKTNFNPNGNIT
ncbi:MAG: AAA family ATPase [Bacteroidota bacterium]|nr:AAA family ATPase [Bacteroidota bacterium]